MSPLTTMADTKRDDHEVSSIGEGEASHEMRVLASAREHLPAIPDPSPSPGHGEETHDIARASTLRTKGPSDDDGTKHWSSSANVVVPQDPKENEDHGDLSTTAHTPITGQGPPSFAQSEFYTVHFDLAFPPLAAALIIDLPRTHVDCPSPTP